MNRSRISIRQKRSGEYSKAERNQNVNTLPLISVIVPIYKTEAYLDRCVSSIAEQTYLDLEIILVDDGSPDNCPQLCDAWAERDGRIRVIHKENGGLSDARNAGLAAANGAYICFVDGDDWIEPMYVQNLLAAIRQNDCDAAGCAHRKREQEQEGESVPKEYAVKVLERMAAMSALIDHTAVQQVVWNKLYKRELIEGILFEKGKYHEDEFWSYQVFGRVNRYAAIDYIGYNYFQRADSIMGEAYSLKRLDAVEAKTCRQAYLEENMPELAGKGRVNLLFTCMYHGQMALKSISRMDERKRVFSFLNKTIRSHPVCKNDIRQMSMTHRLWMNMASCSLSLACRVRNTMKVGY